MEIEAAYCSISGHVERGLGGYLELTSGSRGRRLARSGLLLGERTAAGCPYTGFLTLGRVAPSLRPPGPAILARSGRPFPAGGCPTHTYFVGEEHSCGCQ